MRIVKFAGAAVAAVIVVIAVLLVIGIPSGFLTSAITSKVESATGFRMTIAGTTRISLWPTLNVTLNDVTLQDPKDRSGISRLTIDRIKADMTLASAWSGHPHVNEIVVTHPVLYQQLLRERLPSSGAAAKPAMALDTGDASIDRIRIVGGEIAFSAVRDRVDSRISAIDADATFDADRKVKITGTARPGEHALSFDVKATLPAPPVEHQTTPVDFAIDMPDVLHARLTGRTDVRLTGSILMFNGVSGHLGDGAFNGWAAVDIASKPLVKLDLDFQRLNLPLEKSNTPASQPWSNAPIDVSGLNYVDAQVRISASEANIGEARLAPLTIDGRLAGGVLKAGTANLGAYGGQVSGEVILDATSGAPSFAMHSDLVGVRALPLLNGLAGFDRLDGKLQAKLAVRSAGPSQRALMSNMQGTVFVNFQDGAIRGINVAQMIRSLTTSTLSGWQEGEALSTDLTQLSASFRIDKGQAVTTDLNLVGPLVKVTGAGTVDLGTKLMAFRVEPKLVMTTEGQGRVSDPVGFGIPVMIDGPWSQPRIYPDMAGVLDNPDAAYAKLREMGKGLFGPGGAGLGSLLGGLGLGGSSAPGGTTTTSPGSPNAPAKSSQDGLLGGGLGEALGNLIQQGLGGGTGTGTGTGTSRSRSMPAAPEPPASPAPPAAQPGLNDPPQPQQDSQPMNDVLRQLFNR
jgi:AsmA protein